MRSMCCTLKCSGRRFATRNGTDLPSPVGSKKKALPFGRAWTPRVTRGVISMSPPKGLRSAWTRRAGALVLVTENQPPLLEVVRRHLHRHAIPGKRLDAILLHLAGG